MKRTDMSFNESLTPHKTYLYIKNDDLAHAILEYLHTFEIEAAHIPHHQNLEPVIDNDKTTIIVSIENEISGLDLLKKKYPKCIFIQISTEDKDINDITQTTLKHVLNTLEIPVDLKTTSFNKDNVYLTRLIKAQNDSLKKSTLELQEEINLAGKIHKALLVGRLAEKIPGFSISTIAIPSQAIDGDFFEFYRPDREHLDVVIADVMGKGISAALIGIFIQSRLRRFAKPLFNTAIFDRDKLWHEEILDIDEIIAYLHAESTDQLAYLEYFVTLFYIRFNIVKRTLQYLDLGASKPIRYNYLTKKISLLEGNNFPLGISSKETYIPKRVHYNKGDIFIFYSDGVTEAMNDHGEQFGVERLCHLLQVNSHLNSRELTEKIKHEVLLFSNQKQFQDDFTLLVIQVEFIDMLKHEKREVAHYSSTFSQLSAVRQQIKQFLYRAPGDSNTLIKQMQLAIDEIFSNIIKHSYRKSSKHTITIESTLTEEGVIFDISDTGFPFNVHELKPPDFTGHRSQGFGLYIVGELVDEIAYIPKKRETGRNRFRLFKKYIHGDNHMEYDTKKENNILIITPKGNSLDAKDVSHFKSSVTETIRDEEASGVILDLKNLHFIDSSGLGSLLSILRAVNMQGSDLRLSNMNKEIRTMFQLVKMHKIFEIYNSTQEALDAFK